MFSFPPFPIRDVHVFFFFDSIHVGAELSTQPKHPFIKRKNTKNQFYYVNFLTLLRGKKAHKKGEKSATTDDIFPVLYVSTCRRFFVPCQVQEEKVFEAFAFFLLFHGRMVNSRNTLNLFLWT